MMILGDLSTGVQDLKKTKKKYHMMGIIRVILGIHCSKGFAVLSQRSALNQSVK